MGKRYRNEFDIVKSLLEGSKTPKGKWDLAKYAKVNLTITSIYIDALAECGYMNIEGFDGESRPLYLVSQKGIELLKPLRTAVSGMEDIRKALK